MTTKFFSRSDVNVAREFARKMNGDLLPTETGWVVCYNPETR